MAAAAALNPLERLREQQAQRLLQALQSDLRAQIRLEDEEEGRRGRHKPPRSAQQRLQQQIAQLQDPKERERLWSRVEQPRYQSCDVRALPKVREFWRQVDVTAWTRKQLDAACELLDLPTSGKKADMVARIQDWVFAPELMAQREEQDRLEREREEVLASGRVFACGSNSHGELGLGDRIARCVPTEIERFQGEHVIQVFSGFDADFAFAVTADGRVFSWGGGGRALVDLADSHGATATPSPTTRTSKAPPFQGRQPPSPTHGATPAPTSPTQVASEPPERSCFLLPREIPFLSKLDVASIACGRSGGHIAFTSEDGSCFTWGRGDYGELGIEHSQLDMAERLDGDDRGVQHVRSRPVAVSSFQSSASRDGEGTRIVAISVGNSHSTAISEHGELFVWGACWSGQLGLGVSKRSGVRDRHERLFFPTPTLVETFAGRRVVRVACGAMHTAVISSDGELFTFGCGDGGRLGLGASRQGDVLQPERVQALEHDTVIDVVCGSWHSLCLVRPKGDATLAEQEGYVYAFGSGLHGQLGLGRQKTATLPTRLPQLSKRQARCRAIATSSYHSCALTSDGAVFTWGQNAGGCLGRATVDNAQDSADPDVMASFSGYGVGPVVSIACGDRFTVLATGPWSPVERRPIFNESQQLNRHAKFQKHEHKA
ncbi:hypothetical protein PINS_up002471 [Pythium insidiosum]|nr:hypothetical protein PINS_up002471 [Pythium insidiosum]